MITIQKNKKPKLKACEMICDKELNSKLNKYELTNEVSKRPHHEPADW